MPIDGAGMGRGFTPGPGRVAASGVPVLRTLTRAEPLLGRALWAAAAFSGVGSLLALVPALFSIQVYDRVLGSRSGATLLMLLLITLFSLVCWVALDAVRQRLLAHAAALLDEHLAPLAAERLLQGDGGRALADLALLRQAVGGHAMAALFDAPWLLLVLLALALLHPLLGGVAAVGAGLAVTLVLLQQRLQRADARALGAQAQAQAQATDALPRNAPQWRLQRQLGTALDRWRVQRGQWLARQAAWQARSVGWSAWLRGLKQGLQSLLLAGGAWLVIGGDLTPGVMIGATLLFGRLLGPLEALQQGGPLLLEAGPAAARLAALLQAPGALVPTPVHAPAPEAEPAVPTLRLRDASFGWPGQSRPLLKGLSFTLAPGECVALLGPAAAGKTTLARLAVGLLDPVLGQVLADERPWAERERDGSAARRAWWSALEPLPAAATLRDAVTGADTPDAARLDQAAQVAGVAAWVATLAAGWATPLGPGGLLPSLHQAAGLALARVVYARPQIAVFDEPGVLTDGPGLRALRETLALLQRQGCSVLLITGRRSWARLAPRWLLLRDGVLVADGPAAQVARQLGPTGTEGA